MPRRRKRNGQFTNTHHHAHAPRRRRRSSTSTALVRSSPRVVVVRSAGAVTHRRRSHRRRHSGGGSGFSAGGYLASLKIKGEVAGWASLLGYLKTQKADTYDKIPTLDGKISREAVLGLVLNYFGRKHKHVDRAAVAALAVAGFNVGVSGYSTLAGDDE
jgi:hypothetical protein